LLFSWFRARHSRNMAAVTEAVAVLMAVVVDFMEAEAVAADISAAGPCVAVAVLAAAASAVVRRPERSVAEIPVREVSAETARWAEHGRSPVRQTRAGLALPEAGVFRTRADHHRELRTQSLTATGIRLAEPEAAARWPGGHLSAHVAL
jgi:hypothetical protein